MDQPKIERMLRLMKMMAGNVNYSIDELAEKLHLSDRSIYRYIDTFKASGFVVEKLYGNVYKLGKMPKNAVDISKLIYFSEEEAYIVNSLINNLDESNTLKSNLQKKLSVIYDSTNIADFVGTKTTAANVEALGEAIKEKKKVILRNYESASSHTTKDRLIEPFGFTQNYIDVWAYDLENNDNRVFKISRIEWVDVTEEDWTAEKSHRRGKLDCFRMQSFRQHHIRLQLGLRAKNLLVEEYPMAESDLKREGNNWVLDTMISDLAGVGRFVAGLAHEIKILEGEELKEYLRDYTKNYMMKI